MDIDERRPPKERTLVHTSRTRRVGVSLWVSRRWLFGASNPHTQFRGQDIVVFWSKDMNAAMAYSVNQNGYSHRFEVRNSQNIDQATESTWQLDGRAIDGTLQGTRLRPIANTYVAFWFAWAAVSPGNGTLAR